MKWVLIIFIICTLCEKNNESIPDDKEKSENHLTLTMINGLYSSPANVNVTFFALDHQQWPVSTLLSEQIRLAESGQLVSSSEAEIKFDKVEIPYKLYGLILLDLSVSMRQVIWDIDKLEEAIKNFIVNLDSSYRIALYAFDGQQSIHEISPGLGFTNDRTLLLETAYQISEFQSGDPATNLYGAVIEGIETLETLKCGKFSQCNLLVFTDGTDSAKYYDLSEMQSVID